MTRKWLHWATIDLENGLGGAEMHARCLARELERLGYDCHFSQDPRDLFLPDWDVIHTRGSVVDVGSELQRSLSQTLNRVRHLGRFQKNSTLRPVWVQGLHGTTLGRMAACGEWTWPGGYLAAAREVHGAVNADLIVADHADIWLFQWLKRLGKPCFAISNGWDSFPADLQDELPPPELTDTPYWLFLGRGGDPVKATDRIEAVLNLAPEKILVAAPGEGFVHPQVKKTGSLSRAQLQGLLRHPNQRGLVLTSHYEGLPLVVLEALGLGTPVVTTNVGGLTSLPEEIQGLTRLDYQDPAQLLRAMNQMETQASDQSALARAQVNRQLLPSWREVTQRLVSAVEDQKRILADQD